MSIIDIILRENQRSVFHSLKVPAPEDLGVDIEIRLLIIIIIEYFYLESDTKKHLALLETL